MSGPHPDPLSDMLSKPHELDGRFEREAKTVTTCISDAALTSIAVSLKRIADGNHRNCYRPANSEPLETQASPVVEVLEVRACKDCQWWDKGEEQLHDGRVSLCRWLPGGTWVKVLDWCAQFHPREDGEDVRTVAKPADS